jgi:hypothetical protein
LLETSQQRGRRKQIEPCRRQLDRQRETIETAHDVTDIADILGSQDKSMIDLSTPLDKHSYGGNGVGALYRNPIA